jgi:hypothetical protein
LKERGFRKGILQISLLINTENTRKPAHNSTYKKLAVQWLNEALCFVSSAVVADSFRLQNRQLLVAAKRYAQGANAFRIMGAPFA